jgi:group I intron endonuclease
MSFNNLHLEKNINDAKSALKGKSGVYAIVYSATGAIYIGSSKCLDNRFIAHFIKCDTNPRLQNAISKYGREHFVFHILEFVPENMLVLREQYYLDLLFNNLPTTLIYNMLPTAYSNLGYKATEETRAKLSASLKGNIKLIEALKGNIKLSEALKGNINAAGSERTKEVRAQISKSIEGNTNRAKAVFVYSSLNNILIYSFITREEAAKFLVFLIKRLEII